MMAKCVLMEQSGYVYERELTRVPVEGEVIRVKNAHTGDIVSLRVEAVAHTPDDERAGAVLGVVALNSAESRQRPEKRR